MIICQEEAVTRGGGVSNENNSHHLTVCSLEMWDNENKQEKTEHLQENATEQAFQRFIEKIQSISGYTVDHLCESASIQEGHESSSAALHGSNPGSLLSECEG